MVYDFVVAGGSGYLGLALTRQLLKAGATVRVFGRIAPDFRHPNLDFVVGDIRDSEAVRRACRGGRTLFHLIAHLPLAKDAQLVWSVNRDGTRTLLGAALRAGIQKVVYTSTSAVFGVPAFNPVTDQTPPAPQEEYGASKLAGEEVCAEYRDKNLDVSIVRPVTILGGDRLGIFQILFEWIYQGQNVPVFGQGDNLYQFVHISDVVDACIAAARKPGCGIYNVGAEHLCSMRHLLQALIQHAGSESRIRSVPMGLATFAIRVADALRLSPLGRYHAIMYGRDFYFDLTHAKIELGWSPKYGHIDMITESYDYYCRNRAEILSGHGERSVHRSSLRQRALRLVPYLLF